MRKLMWFTVGFTIACILGAYFLSGAWLLIPAAISLSAGVLCFINKNKHSFCRITTVISLGCLIGVFWILLFNGYYIGTAKNYDGIKEEHVIEITDYSEATSFGVSAHGTLKLDNKQFKVKVYLPLETELNPGDCLEGKMRLRLTTDGGKQAATYHQGKGIFLLVYTDEDVIIHQAEHTSPRYFAAQLRKNILKTVDSVFPEDTKAFASALLLGETSDLSYEVDTAFKLSGIRHVIAVSGLHVSILFSLVYLVAGKRRVLTAILGIPVLFIFAAVAGFSPSIVRACLMQVLMIAALLCKKEYDPPTALAFAVLVMLICNPVSITSVSLQLSAGCMVGIFVFSGRINKYFTEKISKKKGLKARAYRWLIGSFSVTIGAMITTTPLCAYYFHTVSLIGILTNLLTLWLISFIFYGIMAACILGAIWLPLGSLVAGLVSWGIRYVLLVATTLSKIPIAAIFTCSLYVLLWLIFVYFLITIFLLSKKKRPALLTACMIFSLILCIAVSWIEPRLDHYRITILDVGQGQCILLQSGSSTYIVDCGGTSDAGSADAAAQMLGSQGIGKVEGLILTHYDDDHIGGVQNLLTRIDVETLYLPTGDFQSFYDSLTQETQDKVVFVGENRVIHENNFTFSLFPSKNTEENAETSMGILCQIENYDILITGDMNAAGERKLLEYGNLPKLELLVIGHHGSNSSTSWDLLEATRPAAAVISVDENNHYGHPSQSVLNKLKIFGCKVYRTDLQGTIIFRR